MGFFNKLSKIFSPSSKGDEGAYWVYVKCNRCGEQLSSRIDLYNDLSVEYEGERDLTFLCRKTLVGGTGCFQRIEVQLKFNKNRKMVDRQISGGEYVEGADVVLES